MTLILDSGAVTALAGDRARLTALRDRDLWPPQVPAVVLTESLRGDARRDVETNRLLSLCQIRVVDEALARAAARLRTATGRAGTIAVTDAVVVAYATTCPDPIVLTSDPDDLRALASGHPGRIGIARV